MIQITIAQTLKQRIGLRAGLILLTLLAALALPLALPNEIFSYGNPWLGLCCLTAYFLALTLAPSFRFSVILGMLFAAVDTLLAHYWLLFFGDFSIWTITGATIGYMGYHALCAPVIFGLIRLDSKYRFIIIAVVWAFYEFLKSTGFLGFPWGILPHTVATFSPLIQLADITGLWGISFIVALVNALWVEVVLSLRSFSLFPLSLSRLRNVKGFIRKLYEPVAISFRDLAYYALFTGALVIIVLLYGSGMLLNDFKSNDFLKVLLVQPNEDPWSATSEDLVLNKALWLSNQGVPAKSAKDATQSTAEIREQLKRELEKNIPPEQLTVLSTQATASSQFPQSATGTSSSGPMDLIIWSETSFPYYLREERSEAVLQRVPQPVSLASFIKSTGAHFILGAAFLPSGAHNYQNSALLISPEGKIIEHYAKQHPVPIAESIPFWDIKLVRNFFQNNLGLTSSGWEMGTESTIFNLPLQSGKILKFGIPICFEDSFPDVCRSFVINGADFLVNITNVSWSKQKSAEIQMLIASLFRTIENRRTLIRSTNGGVTAIINPKGEIVEQLEMFVSGTLYANIPISNSSVITFYSKWGDYLPVFFAYILLAYLVWHNYFNNFISLTIRKISKE